MTGKYICQQLFTQVAMKVAMKILCLYKYLKSTAITLVHRFLINHTKYLSIWACFLVTEVRYK